MKTNETVSWQYKIADQIMERLDTEQIRHLCQRVAFKLSIEQMDLLISRIELLKTAKHDKAVA